MICNVLDTSRLKKNDNYENIHSVNPLYVVIHSATGHVKEENHDKYLFLDLTDKYEDVWSGIRSEIKAINSGKELFFEKN